MAQVSRSGGEVATADLDAADVLQRVEHEVHRDAASATEVDDLADHVGGLGLYGAVHRIRNVGELACLLAIPEDLDLLVVDEGLHETAEGHIRPLARPEYGEVAERSCRYAKAAHVNEREVFGGELCHPVGRHRSRQRAFLRGEHLGVAVDGLARGEDKLLNVGSTERFAKTLRGDEVVVDLPGEVSSQPRGS